MGLSIVLVIIVVIAICVYIYVKKTQKAELEGAFNRINSLSRKQLSEMCEDLLCYSVWAKESPKEHVPLEVCNKYGCSSLTYSDAEKLREAAVKQHNYLLEKEQKIDIYCGVSRDSLACTAFLLFVHYYRNYKK